MFLQSSFLTEFLSESNLVLTQEDVGNKLHDLFAPIRTLLHRDQTILAFSLARYCGANTRLAFFCQWYFETSCLQQSPLQLVEENRLYLRKKVPLKLRGVPNLHDLIDSDIENCFLPEQLAFMQNKSFELIQDLLFKHEYLGKYLSPVSLSQFRISQVVSHKYLYAEDFNFNLYLEAQETRTSFLQISLPCLLGFAFSFNQVDNPVNPKAVKWVLVEEIFRLMAALHQTALDKNYLEMVYRSRLNDKDQFEWLQLSPEVKTRRLNNNQEVKDLAKSYRRKLYERVNNHLQNLVFPDKYTEMLKDLSQWVFSLETEL
jgi:hypothetical protein